MIASSTPTGSNDPKTPALVTIAQDLLSQVAKAGSDRLLNLVSGNKPQAVLPAVAAPAVPSVPVAPSVSIGTNQLLIAAGVMVVVAVLILAVRK